MVIILETAHVNHFRNIRSASLSGMGDLNVIIGPNNSGKTNLLELLSLEGLSVTPDTFPHCSSCGNISRELRKLNRFCRCSWSFTAEDMHLYRQYPRISYAFSKGSSLYYWLKYGPSHMSLLSQDEEFSDLATKWVEHGFTPGLLEFNGKIYPNFFHDFEKRYSKLLSQILSRTEKGASVASHVGVLRDSLFTVELKHLEGDAAGFSTHASLLLDRDPETEKSPLDIIRSRVLLCKEGRLEVYMGEPISGYVKKKNLAGAEIKALSRFLAQIVDPDIRDFRSETWNLIFGSFEDSISDQGSGVRSVVCLATDILRAPEGSVILIDEPELGLHPAAKQALLSYLLEMARDKQVFIATHDPCFTNPTLWKHLDVRVEVFFYSSLKNKFIKLDRTTIERDPGRFAGILPQSSTPQLHHLYVEGPSDICILEIFANKHFRMKHPRGWHRILHDLGIFHLGGDVWQHLLYTVPMSPFKCIIVLDGDKRELAKQVCKTYLEATRKLPGMSKFEFCEKTEDLESLVHDESVHPVYSLSRNSLPDYLNLTSEERNESSFVKAAEETDTVPKEIAEIFDALLS